MAICETCGASQFDNIDGLYYCSYCQTQSQNVRDIEAEDNFNSASFSLSLAVATPKKRQEKEEKKVDKGRAWTTHEAFQLIICEQVKALIKLGASSNLESVVFKLWTLYLSKMGVAFCEESRKRKVLRTVRDKYTKMCGNAMVNPGFKRKQVKEEKSESEAEDDEEFVDWNYPEDENITLESGGVGYAKRLERMTMLKTPCFCYLGLLYANNLTTPTDLIRWIVSGDVPYLKASLLLPSDMKFSAYDRNHFCRMPLPRSYAIRSICGKLAHTLSLGTLPAVDMRKMSSRFIVQLNLPGELHHLMQRLFSKYSPLIAFTPEATDKLIPNYEVMALAYIVILLKLILGLNDQTERQLSDYGRKIAELVKQEPRLFIWDDWVDYMKKRTKITGNMQLPDTTDDVTRIPDLKPVLDLHEKVLSKSNRFSEFTIRSKPLSCQPETRENLQKPLSNILLEMQMERNRNNQKDQGDPESRPDFVVLDNPMEALDNSDQEEEDNSSKERSDNVEPDFSCTTLTYVTQEDEFLQKLETGHLSNYTHSQAYARCANFSGDSDDDSNDESQFFRPTMEKCAKGNRVSQTVHGIEVAKEKPSNERTCVLKDMLTSLLRGYERYTIYTDCRLKDALKHRSYVWLLQVLCHVVGCELAELETEVQKLELVYIRVRSDMSTNAKLSQAKILKKYFGLKTGSGRSRVHNTKIS